MIERIISGGQYGADIGGLAAAYDLKIQTGGIAPLGYKTIYGKNLRLKQLGLVESKSSNYRIRTFENVKMSDGTIRFAYNFKSPGEICTLNAIKIFKKPHLDIHLDKLPEVETVTDWLNQYEIKILNVAGNAGENKKESEVIFNKVRDYLKLVLVEIV
jgi:hypothetical protein